MSKTKKLLAAILALTILYTGLNAGAIAMTKFESISKKRTESLEQL